MKIKLNESWLKASTLLEKNKKENIIIIGDDYYTRDNISFYLLNELKKNEAINKNILLLDFSGEGHYGIDIMSLLKNNFNVELSKRNFSVINTITKEGYEEFFNVKNKKNIANVLTEYSFIFSYIGNYMGEREIFLKNIYDLLEKLPINEDKEKLIIINEIDFRNIKEYESFKKVIKKLNEKGYFIVLNHSPSYEIKIIEKLNKLFKHKIIAEGDYGDEYLNIAEEKKLKEINNKKCKKFYYIKNKKIIGKKNKIIIFNYKNPDKFPEHSNIEELLIKSKIKDF